MLPSPRHAALHERSPRHRGVASLVSLCACLGLVACSSPHEDVLARCGAPLQALAQSQGQLPSPPAPGLPGPVEVAGSGADGITLDPSPLLRGEHGALRVTDPGSGCAPEVTAIPFVTFPTTPARVEDLGPTSAPASPHRALILTGDDPGAEDDAAAWGDALDALGVPGRRLLAPSRADALDALDALCGDVPPGGAALLVTTGRGTPTGGGALILSREAVSWGSLAHQLRGACGHLGALLWVVDASYAGRLDLDLLDPIPTQLWSASALDAPNAARRGVHRGGALSAALAETVSAQIAARCLAGRTLGAGELWRIFDSGQVRAGILAQRWEELGRPAASGGAGHEAAIAGALAQPIPARLMRHRGAPPEASRCGEDDDCQALAVGCALPSCRALACHDGACVPAPTPGAPCDDGNPCTEDAVCDARGLCAGEVIDCDDGDPCTIDGCEPDRGCVAWPAPAGLPCDDGDVCTEGDACDGEGSCVGVPLDCDDGDPCTLDLCFPATGCLNQPATLPCDDLDPCTVADTCRQGVCAGTPIACDDGNACTANACDPAIGACVAAPRLDGTPCDDLDPCTVADRCEAGVCRGLPAACDDGLDCTFDLCDAGACLHLPAPGFCLDQEGCVPVGERPPNAPCMLCVATDSLTPDAALEGALCDDDGVPCTEARCAGGACVTRNLPGTCRGPTGTCVEVGEPLTECLLCAATGVAEAQPAGAPCDAGDAPCTIGRCDGAGVCRADPAPCCPTPPVVCDSGWSHPGGASPPALVSAWSCVEEPLPGPEHARVFTAPCAGSLSLTLAGAISQRLLVVPGDGAACQQAHCESAIYPGGGAVLAIEEGQVLTLVVDSAVDQASAFSVGVSCACD